MRPTRLTNPSDEHRVRIGRAMVVLAAVSGLSAVVVYLVLDPGRVYGDWVIHNSFGAITVAVLGWQLVGAQPRNRAVWLFPWIAMFQGLNAFGIALEFEAMQRLGLHDHEASVLVSELDIAGTLGAPLAAAAWVPGIVPMVTLALLWFPDGHALTPRWRPVGWLALAATALLTLNLAWASRPFGGGTTSDEFPDGPLVGPALLGFAASVVLSVVALVLRYRRSRGARRRQFRWIAWATGLTASLWLAANLVDVALVGRAGGPTFQATSLATLPLFLTGYAIAIWRHQLFDIDVVISRTLLFGSMALFIAAVYVGVVFGLGSIIGRQDSANQTLSLAATVLVAFLFQPVRDRLERAANRLVYGTRATPYEVLSDLSTRLGKAESTEGLLDRMAALLAEGTGAEAVVVWRWSNPGYEPLASWPATEMATVGSPPTDDLVPIERAGTRLGAFTITKRRGEELNAIEQRLIDDLAGSAGLVLDKARLDTALSDQAQALFESRRRLVNAQANERQRLEGQLRAGTRQQLNILRETLTAGAESAASEGLVPIADQLAALIEETELAQTEIRALAQGIYPPLLESDGLTAAVENLVAGLVEPVEVDSSLTARFETDIELAAYFCIGEALTNMAKHADATSAVVTLTQRDDGLMFEVADDGVGFNPEAIDGSSTGLTGLDDRLAAIGGRLRVDSEPGQGTTIVGHIPCNQLAAVR